jgi:uncharacterized protein (DUF302 family)
MNYHYTIETKKNFDDAVESVQSETTKAGYRVLHIHDVQANLKEKGFDIQELKIIEICNAKHANSLLKQDPKMSLFMPCRISVYVQADKTCISAMNTKLIAEMVPGQDFSALADTVNTDLITILTNANLEPNQERQ